jgi:hypothetical protein
LGGATNGLIDTAGTLTDGITGTNGLLGTFKLRF